MWCSSPVCEPFLPRLRYRPCGCCCCPFCHIDGGRASRKANPSPSQNRISNQLLWPHARFSYGRKSACTKVRWLVHLCSAKTPSAWHVNVPSACSIASLHEASTIRWSAEWAARNSAAASMISAESLRSYCGQRSWWLKSSIVSSRIGKTLTYTSGTKAKRLPWSDASWVDEYINTKKE